MRWLKHHGWLVAVAIIVEIFAAAFLVHLVRRELSDPPEWLPVEIHIQTGGQHD